MGPAEHRTQRREIGQGALRLRIGPAAETCLIEAEGELDAATADLLEVELRRIEEGGAATIVLDLGGLESLDTSGLGVVIRAVMRSRDGATRLGILRPRAEVERTIVLAGVHDDLPFLD